jgi:oligoendopeptidase F
VAEVASTFNEALLMDHVLRAVTRGDLRRALLGNYLDGVRGTVFRQVQFAEFEWRIHQLAERGEALTGDLLNAMYLELVRKYHGHDQGVCRVDDEVAVEWAYIPHFYYSFYVYQYATSFIASSAISGQVLAGDRDAAERYRRLLCAGGSDYPMELMRRAGIDMETAAPFDLFFGRLESMVAEFPVA